MPDASVAELLPDSALLRRTMVECQIRTFDVTDQTLLERLLEVPRELFLPAELAPLAYSDASLRIKSGRPNDESRVLLPPLVLARLIQGAGLHPSDKILDVAPTTGYSTALFAGLGGAVVALESDQALRDATRANLDRYGLGRVRTILGPLAEGAPKDGPFDVIFINGAVEANLEPLLGQLREGGRLLTIQLQPDNPSGVAGKAMRYEKVDQVIGTRALFDVSAPLLGAFQKVAEFTFS
ncbi:protein-L-isoaspartate O-methyltransferase family protein [Methylocapsa acidiphila]|uniref:protein-L-isoaspartate O-methyltransferase family protein n=1 Tax=Methylocapsa acidiphila TaxID=133552 RepID=UPI00041C7047|nr:protein-L-isoaspartate O-methyltransferase [Methylocapsa acidiphila]